MERLNSQDSSSQRRASQTGTITVNIKISNGNLVVTEPYSITFESLLHLVLARRTVWDWIDSMETLSLLLSSPTPPPFIYLHHPHHPTTSIAWPGSAKRCKIDAIECHNPKLLWSAIVSKLEDHDAGLIDSMDTFLRRLRALGHPQARVNGVVNGTKGKGKGKGKERETTMGNGHTAGEGKSLYVIITKAERLPRVLGQNWTVMTRLAELVCP